MGVKRLYTLLTAMAVIVLAVPLMTVGTATAQTSTLEFKNTLWDFGNIKEADGPVTHIFEFTNKGSNAIVIERVSVSCGCTTPEYSREPVLPGKKGSVKVTYDPAMRPGHFSKDVYVVSNNGKNADKLTVTGDVEARPRTVEQDYPYLFSDKVRLSSLSANFRYVSQGGTSVQRIKYTNVSKKPVKLTFEVSPSDGMVTIDQPGEVCAGCKGEADIRVRVPHGDTYGKLNYRIIPVIDGEKQKLTIAVNAIATEDFTKARTGLQPEAKVTPSFHNFGKVKKGGTHNQTFTFENTGNGPLIIRSVIPQEGITTDLKEGTTIAPGKSVKVKCTLKTAGAPAGTFTKIVTVIINDPVRPMREIRLAATVE